MSLTKCLWRAVITAALVAGMAASAMAQPAEVYCAIADSNLTLKLLATVQPRGGQGALPGSLKGSLDIHHQKVPRERRSQSLDGRTFAQFWNYGSELKLRLFIEQGDDRVDLVIDTKVRPGTEGDYAGNFRLETTDGVRVTGRVECSRS